MPPKHNDVETEQTAKPDSGSEAQKILNRPGFDSTRVWVFDLDNTLYPADCNLFAQVDHRMGEFIQNYLGVSYDYARHLQKSYYRQFGTTLAGLMQIHKLEPSAFLDYVHDIDLTMVHYLSGAVGVKGAEPGDLLVVDLLDIGA